MRRHDPRIFYGPALPLDGRTVSRAAVTFEDTALDTEQARLLAMMHERPSTAQASTPPDVALGAESPLASGPGAAAAANEYRWHEQVYTEICRRVLDGEGAAPAGR